MTVFRGRQEIDHSKAIRKVKFKWTVFQHKISTFKAFLQCLCNTFQKKNTLFFQFQQHTKKITAQQYLQWDTLFTTQKVSWLTLTAFFQQRQCLNAAKLTNIKQSLSQFKVFQSEMKSTNAQNTKRRQQLQAQFVSAVEEKKSILSSITITLQKIDRLTKEMAKHRMKRGQTTEVILKTQFQLRLSKMQLQNLQVRISRANSKKIQHSERLLNSYQEQDVWLDHSALQVFNLKLLIYMNQILEVQQISHRRFLSCTPPQLLDLQQQEHRKVLNDVKIYLKLTAVLCKELSDNLVETDKSIRLYMDKLLSEIKDTYATNIFDRRFMQFVLHLNEQQCHSVQLCSGAILKQMKEIEEYLRRMNATEREVQNPHIPTLIEQLVEEEVKCLQYAKEQEQQNIYQYTGDKAKQNKLDAYLKYYVEAEAETLLKFKNIPQMVAADVSVGQQRTFHSKEEQNIYSQYKENKDKSTDMINRILNVLYSQWSQSTFFHEVLKEEIEVALNRKRPEAVQHIKITHMKVNKKHTNRAIERIETHPSEIFKFILDFWVNYSGEVALEIETRFRILGKPPLKISILIKEFNCPLRICFCPYSLGKSYVSFLKCPVLNIDLKVKVGNWEITKIPFILSLIKIFIMIKFRRKFMWPKRMTLSIPLAFQSTLELAVQQRDKYEREIDKQSNKKYN